ncbi:male-enhanced antigen 1-like [Daphnia pulicaria]|uniref:male-enhanced antigen 1-like n=1 Tax=Daphnia pulicaria TaxID=35523 RepID=UPI001EEBC14A|nr:male-enhanced antigen 1-like [Daphnia pulicaria]
MTGNSPEPDSGRLPDNIDENNSVHDEFNGDFNERDLTEIEDTAAEEQQIGENGYELLPTSLCEEEDDDCVEFGYSTYDGQEFQIRTSHNYHNLVTIENPTSAPAVTPNDKPSIPLDTTQIETIKSIMSKVTLPSTAIPVWAHSVSDDQLKQVVDEKVKKGVDEAWAVFD